MRAIRKGFVALGIWEVIQIILAVAAVGVIIFLIIWVSGLIK